MVLARFVKYFSNWYVDGTVLTGASFLYGEIVWQDCGILGRAQAKIMANELF